MKDMVETAVTCEDSRLIGALRKAGADEVILALENGCFSALKPFAADEIIALVSAVHQEGMTLSVLMNRLFPQDEIASFQNQMIWLLNEGADHIIAADPGLLYHAQAKGVLDRVIFDPETLMTNSRDALFYSQLGVSSVMISQLLCEEEILAIARNVPGCSLCVFGHQLMSVSGRPLLEAYALRKGTDSLRGRKNLLLKEEKREEKMPAYENDYAAMIYSDYIQDSFDQLVSFAENGISRIVLQGVFLPEEMLLDAAATSQKDLAGDLNSKEAFRKKYSAMPLSDGYYGIKTIK